MPPPVGRWGGRTRARRACTIPGVLAVHHSHHHRRSSPLVLGLFALVLWPFGTTGCDARQRSRPPSSFVFREANFFPPHQHTVRSDVTDFEWAYYQQGGGLAVGDFDSDGLEDLFASGGAHGHQLFRNVGAGRFVAVPEALPAINGFVSSATFADVDGDGDDDLLLSHLLAERGLTLLINDGGRFVDHTAAAGLGNFTPEAAWSTSFADIDADGDLDFFVAQWLHWRTDAPRVSPHMFCNAGDGAFLDCSDHAGMTAHFAMAVDSSFTATFSDLDEDGFVDLLLAADYRRSHLFRGEGDGRFTSSPESNLLEIYLGMGSVVADFDGDKHMDWFVSAVFFPVAMDNTNGNRLMLGDGTGVMRDVTHSSGAADGGWGWGACAADFDLDGDQDLFQVNGYQARPSDVVVQFAENDVNRLFLNDGHAAFSDATVGLGLHDQSHTTSTVCTDFDGDGDIDIATMTVGGQLRGYENALFSGTYVSLELVAPGRNHRAIGARVLLLSNGVEQTRECRIDNTHTSGQSIRLHFGVPGATNVDVQVSWPDGHTSQHLGLPTGRHHTLHHPDLDQ